MGSSLCSGYSNGCAWRGLLSAQASRIMGLGRGHDCLGLQEQKQTQSLSLFPPLFQSFYQDLQLPGILTLFPLSFATHILHFSLCNIPPLLPVWRLGMRERGTVQFISVKGSTCLMHPPPFSFFLSHPASTVPLVTGILVIAQAPRNYILHRQRRGEMGQILGGSGQA